MRWGKGMSGAGIRLALAALAVLSSHVVYAAATSSPQFVYEKRYAMGTVYEIVAYSSSLDRASQAMDAAFRRIADLDRMMSNYDTQSDLSRVGRSAHFRAVHVPPDLYRVIQDSLVYSRLSGGKYDITVAPLVDVWKSAMRNGRIPSPARLKQLRACVGYQKVQLIPPGQIELHSPCMRLDLGSIGKGYAVDRAVQVLRSSGIRDALVNAGGSTLYGMGSPPGRHGWTIRLNDPSGQVSPEVTLRDDSVSTSGQEANSLIFAGEFGHIIDPTTARPMRSAYSVSVIARTATAADGLSTTLFLLGPNAGTQVVQKLPDTAAIWISPKGETRLAASGPKILLHEARNSSAAAGQAVEHPLASMKR